MTRNHAHWMDQALSAARQALPQDVPVGAVIVRGDERIATAWNRREKDHDPTGHAEIIALREAGRKLGDWRLNDAILYVTLEPCPMCAWSLFQARIGTIVYGAADPLWGACGSRFNVFENQEPGQVIGGVSETECKALLTGFFQVRR